MAANNAHQGFVIRGSTNVSICVSLINISTGLGETGLAHTGITARWWDEENWTVTTITPAALTNLNDAHSDGGWKEVDATNAEGMYRFDCPDAMFASGDIVWLVVQDTANNTHNFRVQFDIAAGVTVNGSVTVSGTPSVNVSQINSVAQVAQNLEDALKVGDVYSVSTGGSATEITASNATGKGDDFYLSTTNLKRTVKFVTGNNAGLSAPIVTTAGGYVSATGLFQFSDTLPNNVAASDTFIIVA